MNIAPTRDRGDQPGEVGVVAALQRPERDPLDDEPEQRADDAARAGSPPRSTGPASATSSMPTNAAGREHGGVGEVQPVEDAEDQGEADGEQRVDRTREDAVDDLLHVGRAAAGGPARCRPALVEDGEDAALDDLHDRGGADGVAVLVEA